MIPLERKINFELNEHDALQLLALIRGKIWQDEKIWQPYWKRLAQKLEQSIERTTGSGPTSAVKHLVDENNQGR